MEDYPRNLAELERRFASDEACRDYLMFLRWPDGFRCPRCGDDQFWPQRITLLQCAGCDYQSSVIAGTMFQDTHTPLLLWFRAIWYVTSQKNGASALGVQRIWGLGSYRTAWAWLHKLRRAMVRPGRDRLQGRVEVDETFVGGEEDGVRGRRRGDKSLIVIAVEVEGKRTGRIRLRSIPDASAASLHPFIADSVEPGSTLHTDGWPGYKGLEQKGYLCETSVIGKQPKDAVKLLPHVHLIVALLQRWLLGTHHGAVSRAYLGYYLDEFTFRFNRRKSRSRGKLFYRLLEQAVNTAPVPFAQLVSVPESPPTPKPQAVGAT
jgi:transposase-like protein